MTKNGICLDLKKSEYKVSRFGVIFYFSSKMYLDKFIRNVNAYVNEETFKIKNKYKVNANFDLMLAISCYKKIEKRGFYIYSDLSKQEIKENITFINVIK